MRYYSIMIERKAIYCVPCSTRQIAVQTFQTMFLNLAFAGINFNLATSKDPKNIDQNKKNEVLNRLRS